MSESEDLLDSVRHPNKDVHGASELTGGRICAKTLPGIMLQRSQLS